MKRVLFITYYWPPAGGPGVHRIVKLVKYLPHFGWIPMVLTVRDGEYPEHDPSLAEDIPDGIIVTKTPALEPFSLYKKWTGKSSEQPIPAGFMGQSKKKNFTEKIAQSIRLNLFLPDARIGWLPFAWRAIKRASVKHNPDIILTSSPPQTVQLIGLQAKKILNIPWIADFRDPWTDIYYYAQVKRSSWAGAIDSLLEKRVLENVDCITSVSQEIVDLLRHKVERDVHSSVIPNGYDPEDFKEPVPVDLNKFNIAHFGKLSDSQPVSGICSAIKHAMENAPDLREDLQVKFTGTLVGQSSSMLRRELGEKVSFESYKPHSEVVIDMQKSGLLFLIIPETEQNKGILTGKLFEYIGARRPILAIGPKDGAAARVVQDLELAAIFDYNEISEMSGWISMIYDRWKKGKQILESSGAETGYSRRIQTKNLAEIMSRIAGK